MTVICYLRVSKGTGSSTSLVEQKAGFTRFCRERGYEPAATFIERGFASGPGLSEYQRMLSHIRRDGREIMVIVHSLEHLHDDAQERMYRLLELDALGATVLFVDGGMFGSLEAVLQLRSTQLQREKTGLAVKEAMKLRAVRGKGLGRPPYGYRLGADKRLEVVPEEAATVGLIYRLYLEKNMGVRLIARHLNEQGITTRRGGLWSIVGIRDILRNRVYLGTSSRFGFRVPDSHKAIIDHATFAKVQERLTSKTRPKARVERLPFLLSGLARCGYCDNKMIGVNRSQTWTTLKKDCKRKGEYRYYQCQSRTNQSVCQYHTKRADVLERTVLDTLRSVDVAQGVIELAAVHDGSDDAAAGPRLQSKLRALDRRLRNLLDRAAGGAMPVEDLRRVAGDLLWERRLVERRIALLHVEGQQTTLQQSCEHALEMLRELQQGWDGMSPLQRRALLQHLVDRIVVYDDHVETRLRL